MSWYAPKSNSFGQNWSLILVNDLIYISLCPTSEKSLKDCLRRHLRSTTINFKWLRDSATLMSSEETADLNLQAATVAPRPLAQALRQTQRRLRWHSPCLPLLSHPHPLNSKQLSTEEFPVSRRSSGTTSCYQCSYHLRLPQGSAISNSLEQIL